MKQRAHHVLPGLVARLLCAALLLQLLIPAGMLPARAGLAGADGTVLPAVFCGEAAGRERGQPDGRQAAHAADHCVLCRLPGADSLGTGAVAVLTLPDRCLAARPERPGLRASMAAGRSVRSFAARAPPFLPVHRS
ncbi:MAG TPA: DUF2946 family protein [Geminicoccus sp.]|uniref:DUF2946 family protein n=1 Tax=Geminicoccus sp. TaxID=2024832 RepID=UPI002E35209D|nr:DUF2946 family protein [Geminicoccus sp.]HEX2525388.1 DUF2946 family protein [Geminicoccus sp.]